MAPSPPYRRGSNRPRVDSQQETGNPGRHNPQRQGVGRHCGRSTALLFPYLVQARDKMQKSSTRGTITDHDKQPTHRPTQTHPRRNQTAPRQETRKTPSRQTSDDDDEKKKEKQVRGRSLGVGVGEDVRIEVGERVQVEETQGEPQTPRRGFGFPQRLREREEKRKHGVDETNQTKKKEGHIQKPNTGRGLKGLKTIQDTNPRDKKRDTSNQMTKPRPQQKNKQKSHQRLQGSVHCRVEGPMGRPAFSWRVTPGDRGTEGSEDPPPPREPPPVAQYQYMRPDKITGTPRGWFSS